MSRIFYSGTRNASSWAMRAWLALREAGIEFDEQVIDLRRPQRYENLARIAEFSPPGAVPVLVEGDEVIFDSLAIMEYANELGDGALLPDESLWRARARSLLAWQHSGLSGICPRLSFESAFYPDRRALSDDEVADIGRLFAALEACLHDSGGPYLCGELSLADLALVPTVIRIAAHGPELGAWPRSAAWSKRLLARDSVREWLDDAERLPPVYLDDYRG